MKKTVIFFLILLLFVNFMALYAQSGGFTGPGLTVLKINDAVNLRDDTPVVLHGKIIRYLGDEKYLFADDSGTIIVDINKRIWGNISVNENDLIEIYGEVDRGFRSVEIEVDRIKKLNND